MFPQETLRLLAFFIPLITLHSLVSSMKLCVCTNKFCVPPKNFASARKILHSRGTLRLHALLLSSPNNLHLLLQILHPPTPRNFAHITFAFLVIEILCLLAKLFCFPVHSLRKKHSNIVFHPISNCFHLRFCKLMQIRTQCFSGERKRIPRKSIAISFLLLKCPYVAMRLLSLILWDKRFEFLLNISTNNNC